MFRKSDILFIGLVLATATATYVLKYGSEIESDVNTRLARDIELEKEAIDILKADWSLLTNPERMQVLAERHQTELQLETLEPGQIITIDEIPVKMPDIPAERRANADRGITDIGDLITGSVKSGGDQ